MRKYSLFYYPNFPSLYSTFILDTRWNAVLTAQLDLIPSSWIIHTQYDVKNCEG